MYKFFTTKKRDNGDVITVRREDAPEALGNLVMEIHKELDSPLPSDWIYSTIAEAFERLEECESEDEYQDAISEIDGDVYTSDLLEWAKDGWAQGCVDQASREYGHAQLLDNSIRQGQFYAKEIIYSFVWDYIEVNRGSDDESDT